MNYKNLGLAGAGISILGTFLPFLNITNPVTGATMASIQLISGDGMCERIIRQSKFNEIIPKFDEIYK